jgi:hypothetical protein
VKSVNVGLVIGAVAGVIWVWHGFGAMVLVAFCAFVGYLVVGLLEGGIDFDKLRDAFRRR